MFKCLSIIATATCWGNGENGNFCEQKGDKFLAERKGKMA